MKKRLTRSDGVLQCSVRGRTFLAASAICTMICCATVWPGLRKSEIEGVWHLDGSRGGNVNFIVSFRNGEFNTPEGRCSYRLIEPRVVEMMCLAADINPDCAYCSKQDAQYSCSVDKLTRQNLELRCPPGVGSLYRYRRLVDLPK